MQRATLVWLIAVALSVLRPLETSAEDSGPGIGTRVITKFDAVLKVGRQVVHDEKTEKSSSGGQRRFASVYRVKSVNGPWLWLVSETSGVRGWVRATQVVPFDQAIDYYTKAVQANPRSAPAYVSRGIIWRERREYDLALRDLDEAIRLDPHNEVAYNNRGLVRYALGEHDQALADYGEAIRLDPRYALAYNNRGIARHDQGDYGRAIADFSEAIRLDPKFAWAYNNRGRAWLAQKEIDKALADFDEAIRLDPNHAMLYGNRGVAWFAKKEYAKALADYDAAIALGLNSAGVYYNRSLARLIASHGAAAADARILLDLKGWSNALSPYWVLIGYFGDRQAGRDAEARELLDQAARRFNTTTWPYPIIRHLRGEIDEKALLAAANDRDKLTEARTYLGLELALSGRPEDAVAHLRWVKEHGSEDLIEYGIALAELNRIEDTRRVSARPRY